ncbi:MAG TPA: DNA repair protein RecN [Casimicrobiaceae bacterium]|nr:DNA repair protein RecN [Casimicrobiaceae bacterium]
MLKLLSVRNFVVVDALDLELDAGFTVLTGETGAGKSILLDALALLLGDRFELRQLKPGSERAELAASFGLDEVPAARAWLDEQGLAEGDEVLVRRTLDAQGKSRAWINGRPATLAQLDTLGSMLVELHGQHAHQSLLATDAQRALLDGFAGHLDLVRRVAGAWRAWRAATERRDHAHQAAASTAAERDLLQARLADLLALGTSADEWSRVSIAQSRLAHAATLLDTAAAAEETLGEGQHAMTRQLGTIVSRLKAGVAHDPSLAEVVALLEAVHIQLEEAARALRVYRQKVEVDPAELARVEERLAAIHDMARKYRVRPEALPPLQADTEARLAELAASSDLAALERGAHEAEATYLALAKELSTRRAGAATELSRRVSAAMQELAMPGGRLEVTLRALETPQSQGLESVEFQVASHPKQPLAPLARVASGGELSRIALAIQVVTSEVANVPTLIFDEVDVGIGGAVAATVGRLLQTLGTRRQVLCVTHLPQVAAFADTHYRVVKQGNATTVSTDVDRLASTARVEELARMLAGSAITAKTRAHARELLQQHRRDAAVDA